MIPAGAEYLAEEARLIGAAPAVRATLLPYLWPNGVNAGGTFDHAAFVGPDRIQANYEGFDVESSWISPVLTSRLQVPTSPAVITWGWNSPGFDMFLFWRSADSTTALAAASWELVNQGDTLQIKPYYQFILALVPYRAWVVDAVGDADDFTAWAEDSPGNLDAYQGFAAPVNVPRDVLTYIADLELLGEFTIVQDIEQAGNVSMEAPNAFDNLVAGSHSGLLLNNRQVDSAGVPAPLFSPNKSSFVFGSQDWYGALLRIDLGWKIGGGWFGDGWMESPWFGGDFTEFVPLFLGKITKWGPVSRAVDQDGKAQPNTVEVYAKDFITDCLQKRICLPAADGSPAPLTFGEFLCKADPIVGWSPAPILRSAYFEAPNYNELDHVVALGGGAFSLVTPGLTGARAFRCAVTGANQTAYGSIALPFSGEIFVTGTMRFSVAPGAPANLNMIFLQAIDATGAADFTIGVDNTGAIYSTLGGQSKFNILAYLDVPLSFGLWFSPTNPGYARLWINVDEVLAYQAGLSGEHPLEVRFGAQTAGVAENWTIDFDGIEVRTKYYLDAFQVPGAPFTSIGPVYIDDLAQPDTQTVMNNSVNYTQILTRFPEYGMVQFISTDPQFKPSGQVMIRVVENAGGRHALYIIEALLAAAGLTAYVDVPTLAAAYAAVPDDVVNARFESGSGNKMDKFDKVATLKDFASLGMIVADALKEITSRFLYWIFVDHGVIKIIPYTGTPPASPAMALTASNLYEATQIIDLDSLNAFVTAIFGWYDRNPSLFYVAGTQTAGGQGTGLDFTWNSPVACENPVIVKAKVELLLKFLSAQERLEPVRTSLAGARLELMEVASVDDVLLGDVPANYWITRKEVGLDPGSRETTLQLMRFLGESGEIIVGGGMPGSPGEEIIDLGGVG